MESEQVVEKILADAKSEAQKIVAETKTKIDKAQADLDAELAEFRMETDKLAAETAEDKKARMLAAARMNIKKETLTAKTRIVDELFEKVSVRINTLGDDDYRNLMAGLLLKAVQTGDEEVIIGKNESRINDHFIKTVNRKLGSGYRGNLRLSSERADISGGFILRRGKIQNNAGTDMLIADLRDKFSIEVVAKLFG